MELKDLKELMGRAFLEAVPKRSEGEAEFLSAIGSADLIREFFICMILRMPIEELTKMKEEKLSADDIERKRNEYLVKLATDRDPLAQRMYSELSRVKDEIRENREKTDYMEKKVSESIERERGTLNDRIDDLKAQLGRDQMLAAQYLEDAKAYRKQAEDYREKAEAYQEKINALTDGRTDLQQGKASAAKESGTDEELFRRAEKIKESHAVRDEPAGFLERRRQKRKKDEYEQEMDLFTQELLRRKELSKEQKDYLLSALEEGYSFRIVRRVMIPTLTVDQMKKFVRIYKRKMEGKNR